MKKIPQISFFLSLFTVLVCSFLFSFSTQAQAGGGTVQPINFSDSQQIGGKSFSPVVAIKDPNTNYSSYLAGREFTIQAHSDLAGASCITTQKISDSQGQIKADCKADIYGNFTFDIVDANGVSNAAFHIIFTDPAQLSGSGFDEHTPAGAYTVVITSGNQIVKPNQVFSPLAELRKDGHSVSNYDEVDYFRWEVLQGSFVFEPNTNPDHLMKNPKIFLPGVGKTIIRVTAILKNGSSYQSGAVTIDSKYNNNFNNGYNNHYNNGYNNHYNNGFNNHFNNGYNNHYNNGFNNGFKS